MSKLEIVQLQEYAGQKCDVVLTKRLDGSVFARIEHTEGYGYGILELSQLKDLVKRCEAMKCFQ